MDAGTWVRLSDWKADPPIVQSLTSVHIWPTLTPKQRTLVASCRETVDETLPWPDRYKVIVDRLKGESPRTLRSLESKGVVDERGVLTIPGIYTALWNRLDDEREAKAS